MTSPILISGMDHCSVFSTQGKELGKQEKMAGSSHIITTGNQSTTTQCHSTATGSHSNATLGHSNAMGIHGIKRRRHQKETSDSSSEESFEAEDDINPVKRNLDASTQDFNRDLESSDQGWQLLDTCEPCTDEEVVKGRLKFFFMNLADKFHVTRTIPYHLCLQVKLQSAIKA